jgi:hypothetical protein
LFGPLLPGPGHDRDIRLVLQAEMGLKAAGRRPEAFDRTRHALPGRLCRSLLAGDSGYPQHRLQAGSYTSSFKPKPFDQTHDLWQASEY